ncbi:MAG TPA: hypothetical protein VNM48_15320 [Chloroflexota bacterium]|nr:hypothetical protein [Chloroflexota bacterium]
MDPEGLPACCDLWIQARHSIPPMRKKADPCALGTMAARWQKGRLAPASRRSLGGWLRIVAVAGFLLFDERLDRYTLLGAAIIFAANACIARREALLARMRSALSAGLPEH